MIMTVMRDDGHWLLASYLGYYGYENCLHCTAEALKHVEI